MGACKKDPHTTSSPAAADAGGGPAALPATLARIGAAREGSALALAKLGEVRVALVADEDAKAIRTIDLDAKKELAATWIGGRPGQIAITKVGKLLVTMRDEAKLATYGAKTDGTLVKEKEATTAEEPLALALTPDDKNVLTVSGFTSTVESFDVEKMTRNWSSTVAREPRAVAVSPDGARAVVSHAADGSAEILDATTGKKVSSIDLGVARVPPPPPRRPIMKHPIIEPLNNLMLDFAISKQLVDSAVPEDDLDLDMDIPFIGAPARFARQAFAMIIITDPKGGDPTVIIPLAEMAPGDARIVSTGYGGGGIEEDVEDFPSEVFDITRVSLESGKRVSPAALTLVRGKRADKDACRLPRAVAKEGDTILVACLGSSTLQAYDATKPVPALAPKWRAAVPAGPAAIAVDPEKNQAVVLSTFDAALSVVSLGDGGGETIPITRTTTVPAAVQKGRKLFHSSGDARISKDGRACASCHPDGRDDGLVWSTPDGPRQTIFLAGRVSRKAPYGWMGDHASLQQHMEVTMKNLKGTGLEKDDRDALAAYIQWMKGPARTQRPLTPEEDHGKDVFASGDTACATCHDPKSDFSDHATHDVRSSLAFVDRKKDFLAPSLVNIGASAPYFHDGRYASLSELLDKCDGSMGYTKHLSPSDKAALVAYLKTL